MCLFEATTRLNGTKLGSAKVERPCAKAQARGLRQAEGSAIHREATVKWITLRLLQPARFKGEQNRSVQ